MHYLHHYLRFNLQLKFNDLVFFDDCLMFGAVFAVF